MKWSGDDASFDRCYYDLIENLGLNSSSGIQFTPQEFASHFALYSHDFTHCGCSHYHIHQGKIVKKAYNRVWIKNELKLILGVERRVTVGLSATFNTAPSESLSLLVYTTHYKILSISADREVSIDY